MKKNYIPLITKLIIVILLLQTLFFKFTGAPESVYIFSELGLEPYGRIGIGIIELLISILIIIPKTTLIGAILGLGTILGAIFSHLFFLGVEIQNDGGLLFILALIIFFCCLYLIYINRHNLLNFKFTT
ncbi:DoxX family protein [Flavobacterium sp. 316]|uniref:DoxX family protein n=1 Tax=Flavobacterium sediminilitoris TaxID=2024526 RepID=A0ABY4HNP3_9FLAO|nr:MULTISPECIES: DoxX family protein [Flavobacterium]KIX21446.1 DoxX family protein [Flavobacterium sp. 316]UOX34193.1 DoxX family protein [Flavobacterium sediminilitoris]